jgi:hypothetical protein
VRIPIRTPAVAATDHGRRAQEQAADIRLRDARYATQLGDPEVMDPAQLRRARAGCASASRRRGRSPTSLDTAHSANLYGIR